MRGKPSESERVLVQSWLLGHIDTAALHTKLGARAMFVCVYYAHLGIPVPTVFIPSSDFATEELRAKEKEPEVKQKEPPDTRPYAHLYRVRLNPGGYEYGKHGPYWGAHSRGSILYRFTICTDEVDIQDECRAYDREHARRIMGARYPQYRTRK